LILLGFEQSYKHLVGGALRSNGATDRIGLGIQYPLSLLKQQVVLG